MTEFEQKVVEHDEQIKSLFKGLGRVEKICNQINSLALSVKEIAVNQSAMIDQQKKMQQDVENLKVAPGNTAKDLWLSVAKTAISTIVGAIIGAVIALIVKK